ncbi:MAG: hypothetical protein M0C28_01255 [Candidatus Moduliflexus flocculans]|nr:hypothetical protein [Candidatus Moduliflexus flocculans]
MHPSSWSPVRPWPASASADEALAKKYAPIIGGYELDLTALGGDLHPT